MDSESSREIPVLDAVFELGIERMRAGVREENGDTYFPRICLWVDAASGMIINIELSEPQEDSFPLVLRALQKLIDQLQGIPREIRMRDPQLAMQLRGRLAPLGDAVKIVVRESLPALEEAFSGMAQFKALAGKPQPGLLDVRGMTLDHVIGFAEAAKEFYLAKPWQHLLDADLIEIHSPEGPKGTRFTMVLGAGGQTYGLGFVASREAHEKMQSGGGLPRGGIWSLQFGQLDELPFEDGELWQHRNLPLANGQAYPFFLRFTKSAAPKHPNPQELAFAEGLLLAIARTTEDQLDSGRWEQQVTTAAGPMTFKLSLPILLEQISGGEKPRQSIQSHQRALEEMMREMGADAAPQSQADQIAAQAMESRGRRQLQLAREALRLDPDCVEALLILARRREGDPEAALPMLRRAVEAGVKKLGQEIFTQHAGAFWLLLDTRPYMRARQELALALMNLGRHEEAAEEFRDMLRLNPNDNQGNRYHLAQCLLLSNQLDELDALLNRSNYTDDFSAEWKFTRALLEFRRQGDTPAARSALADAVKQNRFVPPLLRGHIDMPPVMPPFFSPGGEDEAVICVDQIVDGWYGTPGALEWLEAQTKQRKGRDSGASSPISKKKHK
jgi:tetratricopeptide (TPR) repeat protein